MKKPAPAPTIDCLGLGIIPLDILLEIPSFPALGGKQNATDMVMQGGGPVPNTMIGLARLGLRTGVIAAIGNDIIGTVTREELQRERVDDSWLITKRAVSDLAAGFVEQKTGRRTIVLHRTLEVKPRDIVTRRLPIPKLVHVDGRDIPACVKLARWAKSLGAIVSFDIGSKRNDVSPLLPLVDQLVVADAFALPYTRTRSAEAAIRKLTRVCPGTIIVTEGTRGQLAREDSQFTRGRAFRVPVIDTTGAGDAFHTGYLYGLLKNWSMARRLAFGAAVAALKCGSMGARAGLPSLKEVTGFLKTKPRRYA